MYEWICMNINCRSKNRVGVCPNCGYEEFNTEYWEPLVILTCKRCEEWRSNLVCEKCGSRTPVKKSGLPQPGCFIATACYGSPWAPEVCLLREYRDIYLRRTMIGRMIIRVYERTSPSIANWLSRRPKARRLVRKVVMPPLLWIARRNITNIERK